MLREFLTKLGVGRQGSSSPHTSGEQRELLWGGLPVPESYLGPHFALMGTTGSGKTLLMRMLLRSALCPDTLRCRALIYDPKRELYPALVGMGIAQDAIRVLNPFDVRAFAWDLARDIDTPTRVYQLAAALIPESRGEVQPYFTNAAREILAEVIDVLRRRSGGNWTLNDALEVCGSRERIQRVLNASPDAAEVFEAHISANKEDTAGSVLSTLRERIRPFVTIARLWARNDQDRRFSLVEWLSAKEPSVLLLSRVPEFASALDPIARLIFRRAAELVTSAAEEALSEETWVVIDEARVLGRLEGLNDLLLEGRSKGARLVLGFQTVAGLADVYGRDAANDMLGQCANVSILRLQDPQSRSWVVEYFAQHEYERRQYSSSEGTGPGGSSWSSGVSVSTDRRDVVLSNELLRVPLPVPGRQGIHGWFTIPQELWKHEVPTDEIAALTGDLAKVSAFEARPDEDQERVPLTSEDWSRLNITTQGKARYLRES